TFSDDIKRPLPRRTSIVVTRDRSWQFEGVEVAHSLNEAYDLADSLLPHVDEHYVIGGAQLCREAISTTERIYLTVVESQFDGDTWFDSFVFSDWRVSERRVLEASEDRSFDVVFYVLDRPVNTGPTIINSEES
ncbi:MAG: dihydrofolate reductase, partial [Granulosicoccaceae bacterium]